MQRMNCEPNSSIPSGKARRFAVILCAFLLAVGFMGASCSYEGKEDSLSSAASVPQVDFQPVDTSGFGSMTVGAVMPEIDYASSSRIIFHSWFGLFVCTPQDGKITASVDIQKLGYGTMQGSPYTEVSVSGDGKTVSLHHVGGADETEMLCYDADGGTLKKTAFRELPERYVPGDSSKNPLPGGQGGAGPTYGVLSASDGKEKRVYIVSGGENAGDLEFAVCEFAPDGTCVTEQRIPVFPVPGTESGEEFAYLSGYDPGSGTVQADDVEWITLEDTKRIQELKLDPGSDMPSGFYLYNPEKKWVKKTLSDTAELKVVSKNMAEQTDRKGFAARLLKTTAPFRLTVKDGVIVSAEEQYLP